MKAIISYTVKVKKYVDNVRIVGRTGSRPQGQSSVVEDRLKRRNVRNRSNFLSLKMTESWQ